MELTLENIEGNPFQNFLDYCRSPKTQSNYTLYLEKFLDAVPKDIFIKNLGEEGKDLPTKAALFVKLAIQDLSLTKQIVKAYVRQLNDDVDKKLITAATEKNRLKPIKALFAANEIDFSWKLIDKSLPKIGKAQDRAYTREEIQIMMAKSVDIVDKVIITLFSSAGFRVEAWDYLTWGDVKFFYTDEKETKGMALRIYAGDAEEYWTHATPEAQRFLLLYKEHWKTRFEKYPEDTDPLIVATKVIAMKRLRMLGVRTRIVRLLRSSGIRPIHKDPAKRHEVPADHGFRKYFNTMMRRAKVNYLDKEDMMGHKIGLESSYERYTEEDFERFPEYQKAIPFLTISDEERAKHELAMEKEKNSELEKKTKEAKDANERLDTMESILLKMVKENLIPVTPENKIILDQFSNSHKKLS